MFGHACEEPISLITPHPCNLQVAIYTSKQSLTILDIMKNRSIRNFSVSGYLPKEVQNSGKPAIGMFFIDDISCRAYQSVLKSTFQQLPSNNYLAILYPRGFLTWGHTFNNPTWNPFEFVATCAAQAPDSLIVGDNSHTLYSVSLVNGTTRVFANTSGTPSSLFITRFEGDHFGVLSLSSSGMAEFFSSSGNLSTKLQIDNGKSISFDIFTSSLFLVDDKRTVDSYLISPTKIDKTGECSFAGVTAGDTKPTNYNIQQITSCMLPIAYKPLFFAICDSSSLLIGGSTKVVQKVTSFPIMHIKRLNCTSLKCHPTDPTLLFLTSDNNLIVLDIFAHLPQIIPSLPIPDFIQKSNQPDGIYNISHNNYFICVMNHSSQTYTIYDKKTHKIIATNQALNVVLGPNKKYAHFIQQTSRKHKELTLKYYIQIFDETTLGKAIHIIPPEDTPYPLRLVTFDDYFALICGHSKLDTSFNLQSQGHTKAFVYSWNTLENINLNIEDAFLIASSSPLIALASANGYVVYDTSNGNMEEKCRRQKRVFDFKFFDGRLYLLTTDGLEIDNFKSIELVSSRFSHIPTKEKNAPSIPVNALAIKEVSSTFVTVVETNGVETTVGIPEEEIDDNGIPLIVSIALSKSPIEAAGSTYQTASEKEKKQMMLMMMGSLGWDAVEPVLSCSELAVAEYAMGNGDGDYQKAFREFLKTELEIDE
ncbi:hypothetical protein GPJ56_006091 [Histomonas meleagridis]|uniref:uncharacterized protein n=1 Tax=Histomonas meleagridis TaxID=135588 RepID=UPI0035598FD9|nr:hypothetical protein GPJ56_006091 [Histomonas meleagridis]KAH0804058.1 hypothetical protein GO595_002888 [Histomonas meleagridis]